MKELPILTKKFSHNKLIVDDDIYEILKDEKIICSLNGNIHTLRLARPFGYSSENLDILILAHNPKTHKFKFLNGNDFDRRRQNLEIIKRNTDKNRESYYYENKYKGVYWCKKRKCFITNIFINGMTCYLGSFEKPEKAALVYDAACRYLFEGIKYYVNMPNQNIELSIDLKNKINKYLLKQVS